MRGRSVPKSTRAGGHASLGQAVKQVREQRGLSLRQFAEMIDYPASNLSKLEAGQIAEPSGHVLVRIAGEVGWTEIGNSVNSLSEILEQIIRSSYDVPLPTWFVNEMTFDSELSSCP